jgi:hypothetical protein
MESRSFRRCRKWESDAVRNLRGELAALWRHRLAGTRTVTGTGGANFKIVGAGGRGLCRRPSFSLLADPRGGLGGEAGKGVGVSARPSSRNSDGQR